MSKNIQELLQSGLANYIVGQAQNFTTRPEEDARRWNNVINFYETKAGQDEKCFIENILLEMFASKDPREQLPALIIGRNIQFNGLRLKIIDSVQSGAFDSLDKRVQESILISAISFESEEIINFVLESLLEKKRIIGLITWSDTSPEEKFASKHDLWRIQMLARYYEHSDQAVRFQIEQQISTLSAKNPKAKNILIDYLKKGSEYTAFKNLITCLTRPVKKD